MKFLPRESLPNKTALARADALFVELTGLARDELGHAIAQFNGALESQDERLIDEYREHLLALVAAHTRTRC
jgi:molecular chaperone HscC